MIRIAFCDDEISVLNELRVLLDQYRMERNQTISYAAFRSPLDLVSDIEKGVSYDVLFLDVLMPGMTGIEAAEEIRNYDSNVKIIFLASSAEYAVQSYTVGAYFYQLKPVWKDSFFGIMDSVIAVCEKESGNSLVLRCKNGLTRIEFRELEYCEVIHHTLYIHLINGKVLESVGTMEELSKELEAHDCFWRPHRSYLINLDYIKNLSYHAITMSCLTEIPIPRGKYHDIKEAYLERVAQNRWVMI